MRSGWTRHHEVFEEKAVIARRKRVMALNAS